jgi:hypothetical protein
VYLFTGGSPRRAGDPPVLTYNKPYEPSAVGGGRADRRPVDTDGGQTGALLDVGAVNEPIHPAQAWLSALSLP